MKCVKICMNMSAYMCINVYAYMCQVKIEMNFPQNKKHQKVTKLRSKKILKSRYPGFSHIWLPPQRTPVRVFRMSKVAVLGGGVCCTIWSQSKLDLKVIIHI